MHTEKIKSDVRTMLKGVQKKRKEKLPYLMANRRSASALLCKIDQSRLAYELAAAGRPEAHGETQTNICHWIGHAWLLD